MTEKTTFSDVDYTSHKENTKETTIHDEAPQRQASVALNIVDNPLRVCKLRIP